jgi:UDP-N-acetylglucosamine transferase subunit ALG13
MIFVTVGHQMPFDRLVSAVDAWAGKAGCTDIFAQIGKTDYKPLNIAYKDFLNAPDFQQYMRDADCIVAHAGTGTILTALEMCKPILVMPRLACLMETRNNHQIATAERFATTMGVVVAKDEFELPRRLDKIEEIKNNQKITMHASSKLINAIKEFIQKQK